MSFGQHCTITGFPHRHTTQVVMPSQILELDKETYIDIAKESAPLLLGLMAVLQEESDGQAYVREIMTKASARGKVAAALLQILQAYGWHKLLRTEVEHVYQRDEYKNRIKWLDILNQCTPLEVDWLKQQDVADYMGIDLRTVRKELKSLMEDGAISYSKQKIVIRNAHALFESGEIPCEPEDSMGY
jgi:CRP-like cAMP-binding protein